MHEDAWTHFSSRLALLQWTLDVDSEEWRCRQTVERGFELHCTCLHWSPDLAGAFRSHRAQLSPGLAGINLVPQAGALAAQGTASRPG